LLHVLIFITKVPLSDFEKIAQLVWCWRGDAYTYLHRGGKR